MAVDLVFCQKERIGDWVAKEVEQTSVWGSYYAMGAVRGDEVLAGMVFNNFNGSNATVHVAVKTPGKYLKDLLLHCYKYAFVYCGLNRLTAMIEEDNSKSLRWTKHIGFEDEFVMRKGGASGQDLRVMVLWPENFIYRGDV